jgi:hypothetical protein
MGPTDFLVTFWHETTNTVHNVNSSQYDIPTSEPCTQNYFLLLVIQCYIVPALEATGDARMVDLANDISLTTIGE